MSSYRQLLDEAKIRILSVQKLIERATGLVDPISVDSAYLQLRMLCELVALACLIAHGDVEAKMNNTQKKQYAADAIFKMLADIHPDFYLHPVECSRTLDGGLHLEPIKKGFLTKTELIALYRYCGEKLHRGSLAKFRSTSPQSHASDLQKISEWLSKFVLLLREHRIASIDGLSQYLCQITSDQAGGNALVSLAQAPQP